MGAPAYAKNRLSKGACTSDQLLSSKQMRGAHQQPGLLWQTDPMTTLILLPGMACDAALWQHQHAALAADARHAFAWKKAVDHWCMRPLIICFLHKQVRP
jgi:hypothetical protein